MTKPHIALLREANARQGFFEPEQYRAVLKHLWDMELVLGGQSSEVEGGRAPPPTGDPKWTTLDGVPLSIRSQKQ